MSVRDRRNRRERRVAPGRAVPAAVVSSRISRLAARPRGDGVEPVFASESGRGTHLSWALTPANWWVAREEAMVTGGGWGVCAEVSRARRAASGSFAAHSRARKHAPPFFRTARGCDFGACQMARDCAKWAAEKRFRAATRALDRVSAIRFRESRDCETTEQKKNPRIYPKIQTGCHTVRSREKKKPF